MEIEEHAEGIEQQEEIIRLAEEYEEKFILMAESIKAKGSGDLGIIGQFRAKTHEVE